MAEAGESLAILYVGVPDGTCLQRAQALRGLGHRVRHVVAGPPRTPLKRQLYRLTRQLDRPADLHGANRRILAWLVREAFDILWIDKGLTVRPSILRAARDRRPELRIVGYSPDDTKNPGNSSRTFRQGLPLYDLYVTTKSYNVPELRELGAREPFFVDNSYDPDTHRPLELSARELERYAARVGFVGSFEEDRAEQMRRLATDGIEVSIWGAGWEEFSLPHPNLRVRRRELPGLDYSRAINATEINLAFLRKVNRDLQTTRSIEIPACGAFMLAERTHEHLALFDEGVEAEFFSSYDELLEKCRHYLDNPEKRRRIAQAGLARCRRDRYDNEGRLAAVIARLGELT